MNTSKNAGVMPVLFIGVLIGALDISIVGSALPTIEHTLHINSQYSGWIFSIFVLFNLIGISLFARLSDIYGRRNIYILAITIFAAGSLLVSLAHTYPLLLTGRAIQGFGASGILPVASAMIGDLYPPEKRGQLLGLLGAVFGIAFMIGPFIAGVLLHYFTWNVLFIINVPISAILIYFSYLKLPQQKQTHLSTIDWQGIIFLAFTLAGFTYGINSLDFSQWNSPANYRALFSLFVSIVAFFLLVFTERQNTHPIIRFGYFRNQQIVITGIVAVVTGLLQACFVFIPKFVVQHFAVSASRASFMLTPFVLATAIGSPVFGKMIDRYGVKRILLLGLFLSLLGFLILASIHQQLNLYYVSGVLIGLGLSVLAGSSLRYIMLNETSAENRAVAQGMLTIFTSSGQLSGTAVFGLMLGSLFIKESFTTIFLFTALILLLSLLLTLKLKPRSVK